MPAICQQSQAQDSCDASVIGGVDAAGVTGHWFFGCQLAAQVQPAIKAFGQYTWSSLAPLSLLQEGPTACAEKHTGASFLEMQAAQKVALIQSSKPTLCCSRHLLCWMHRPLNRGVNPHTATSRMHSCSYLPHSPVWESSRACFSSLPACVCWLVLPVSLSSSMHHDSRLGA